MTTRPAPTAAVLTLSPALRSAISWVLLAIAVICGAGCAGTLDQARLTPALLLTRPRASTSTLSYLMGTEAPSHLALQEKRSHAIAGLTSLR